jgi:hypothetical protein
MSSCSKARRDKTRGSLVVLDHKNPHAADLTERRVRATPHGADRLIVDGPQSDQTVFRQPVPPGALNCHGDDIKKIYMGRPDLDAVVRHLLGRIASTDALERTAPG